MGNTSGFIEVHHTCVVLHLLTERMWVRCNINCLNDTCFCHKRPWTEQLRCQIGKKNGGFCENTFWLSVISGASGHGVSDCNCTHISDIYSPAGINELFSRYFRCYGYFSTASVATGLIWSERRFGRLVVVNVLSVTTGQISL